MQTIYLDISNKGVVPTVYAKQNDVGRKFAVILTDSGLPYIPEIGSVFSVWYKGASGEGNYTDIGNKSAFSLNGNKVEVEMIVQMLSAHGDGILCLTLNSPNGNQISSWNIPYLCEKVPGFESEGAKEYYTAFSESVEKLKQVTENLTPESIGAAPAGYGLGGNGQYSPIDSLDSLTKNGVYAVELPNAINIAGYSFRYLKVEVTSYSASTLVEQKLTPVDSDYVLRRVCKRGAWGELEWENPPMSVGKEYRTTERFLGKPIYKKVVDFGALPNTTNKTVSHGISNVGIMIDVILCNPTNGRTWTNRLPISDILGGLTTIQVTTNSDQSAESVYAICSCIKSTD